MKVALLTIYNVINYGAELQAYATCRVLEKLGCDVELIDLRLNYSKAPLLSRILYWKQNHSFKMFRRFAFPKKTCRYQSLEALKQNPPIADLYLVGSDQVWNTDITREIASAFFLDFGADSIKRASYASSFGSEEWKGKPEITRIALKRLKEFVGVSVREQSGLEILKNKFGIESVLVLDPTMLFDGYSALAGEVKQKNEIVCYKFIQNDDFFSVGRYISSKLQSPIRILNSNNRVHRGYKYNYPSGVKEWVKSIAESSFVLTDSFHGLAFSIIYRKQFIVFVANPNRIGRLQNLLEMLGLEDRLYYSYDDIYANDNWKKTIDYAMVETKLNELRKKSWNFLYKIINSIEK